MGHFITLNIAKFLSYHIRKNRCLPRCLRHYQKVVLHVNFLHCCMSICQQIGSLKSKEMIILKHILFFITMYIEKDRKLLLRAKQHSDIDQQFDPMQNANKVWVSVCKCVCVCGCLTAHLSYIRETTFCKCANTV